MTLFQSELNKRSNKLAKPMKSNYELIMWQRWSSVVVHVILACVCVCACFTERSCALDLSRKASLQPSSIMQAYTISVHLQLGPTVYSRVCVSESVCARAWE